MASKTGLYYYTKEETSESINNALASYYTKTQIDNLNTYSTTEKAVGKWINGNTLYRKTVNFGALPNATSKNVNHGISNINQIVKIEGIAIESGGTSYPLPFVQTGGITSCIRLHATKTQITINAGGYDRSNFTGYVTLYYTKTT